MRRYTGDPADKPTVVRKLNENAWLPTKKMKLEKDGKYKVFVHMMHRYKHLTNVYKGS